MKTIEDQIKVMQHFADGGKIEMQRTDGSWKLNDAPQWEWSCVDYRIAEEIDPYAELKKAAKDPTKQIRCNDAIGIDWQDAGYEWKWCCAPHCYEIRDKPKPMKKVKLLAWFDGYSLFWRIPEAPKIKIWKRVPSEDKEIEVEDD